MMLPKLNLRLAQFCASTASASRTTSSLSLAASSSSSSLPAAPSPSSSVTSRTRLSSRLTYPLVLLSLLLLVLHPVICNAERDFNFNDSQVPLLEPRDEPILIDGHHYADSTTTNTAINANAQHHHHQHQDPYAVELSHCRYGENELVLSLVLKNYNWQDVSESRRDKVLDKLSKFFAIPKEFITTESVTKHELSEMQKESLKKGNNKCHTNTNNNNNRKLGRVNFIIGCRSSYFSITEPIAKQIGQQFKDGALDNIAGEKFGWWVIWRKQHKTRSTRNRRQAEGSGMIDNDDYDGDYEYEDDEEEIIDEPSKEVPSSTTTNSQQDNNSNRDLPDDDENDVNSNTLEHVTNVDTTKTHNRDDITALKQTDADTNIQEVEKSDSNLLLLNKKGVIDEEIVESVSELESVISKTIENTKNIKEIPEREVDQPEDVLLKEVLQQPTQAYEDSDMNAKNSEHLNLNSIYESPNEEDQSNSHDFSVAEVIDSLSPQTSTVTSGIKLDDIDVTSISSVIGTTTTTSLPRTHHNTNKDNHFENILQNSSSSLNHDLHHQQHHQHHNSGENGEHHHKAATELTSSSAANSGSNNTTTTLLPPLPPIILTDSTTLTLTTPHDNSAIISSPTMTSSVSGSVLSTTTTTSTSTTATTSSITTNNHNNNNKHKMMPYSSNKMIKVDINKYDDEKDVNDDDDDDDNDDNDDEDADSGMDDNLVYRGNFYGLTTVMPPPRAQSPQSSSSSSSSASASASTMRHAVGTTPATHRYKEEDAFGAKDNKHLSTLRTPYHHFYGFASSSSPVVNYEMMPVTTTVLPHESLTDSTTTVATPIASDVSNRDEVLPHLDNNDTGKKEYYDTTFDPEDDEDAESSKSSTITTPQSSEDGVTSTSSTEPSTTTTPAPTSPSTTSTTTTTAVPDYIEPKLENSPPMIKSRLQKLAVTSGKSFKFTVPEDTFVDTEDKSNLRLQLTDKEGRELKTNSWLQFNAETKDIYGLPLDDAVSRWEYRLTATDSGNESVTETVEVSVQQHRGVRTVNHEINIAVKINEKNMHYIDWQLSLIKAIATTLGDDNTNSIVVREIRQNPQDPSTATLVYFNETLPTSECPESELNNLVKRLDANRLSELVQPTLGIKSITGQLIGSCQKTVTVRPKPTVTKNAPPVPRNQVDRVVATAGHLLVYKVPADTFFDPNDSKLVLSLKTKDHKELSPRHWLQFDSKNDEFYGIPKTGDTGSEEYMLVAEDAGGLTATDALVVTVNHAPKREFSVYYKAHLAIRHEQFNADLQRKFVERIAQMFGDASTQNIQIRSINTMHDSDGTLINFYNTTLYKSHNRCPEEEMEAVRNVYLQDNTMRDRVKKALGPELNITNLQVHAYSCSAQTDIIRPDFVPNKTEEPLLKSTFSDDYLYTIILPAVIIVTMILVASIIACCLHRRRRKSGKMELGDEEERKSFRTKGIPVIFQDELDEKPEIGNKSPIILKDEKPPLLPPSYNTSNMNGDNDVDEYVPPPAVVVGGREARGKSPATPSYRKPPPYVSP